MLVTPEAPDGVRLDIPARPTLWGRIEFALYVAPKDGKRRRVAVVGRAGTTIIDDVAELEEFDGSPWTSDQVSGQIVFEALRQTAGRRAILGERDAFPIFVDAVRAIEGAVARTLERVNHEVDQATVGRLSDAVRQIFARVLRELSELQNPMRTFVGSGPGDSAVGEPTPDQPGRPISPPDEAPPVDDLIPPGADTPREPPPPEPTAANGQRSRHLPTVLPDPTPGDARSRFDPDDKVVFYNDGHPDYLLVKNDEALLLDYLAMLVAKEYVRYNNPRVSGPEMAEEMIGMLTRVRRHIPRRR